MTAGEADIESMAPIVRWAGGKRWVLPLLSQLLGGRTVDRYHEPFLGGGAAFLGLAPTGTSYLSDLNAELIEAYCAIRDAPEDVFIELSAHENTSEHYYKVRDSVPGGAVARAGRFLYLNHTSFNGIFRVNLAGVYNVPYGHRKSINPPTLSELVAVSNALKRAALQVGDFEAALPNVREGDLVFLDPPYTVAHNQNGFIKYNQKLFSYADQRRLSAFVDAVADVGAHYILTNAAHESIRTLFDRPTNRCLITSRKNAIGGLEAARGEATEYLFTNLPTI